MESSTRPEVNSSPICSYDFTTVYDVFNHPVIMPEGCVSDQDLLPFGPTQAAQQEAVTRRLFTSVPNSTYLNQIPPLIVPATPVSACFGGFPTQPPTPEPLICQEVPERSMQEWLNEMEMISACGSRIKSRVVDPGAQLPLPAGCHRGDLPKPAFVLLGLLN